MLEFKTQKLGEIEIPGFVLEEGKVIQLISQFEPTISQYNSVKESYLKTTIISDVKSVKVFTGLNRLIKKQTISYYLKENMAPVPDRLHEYFEENNILIDTKITSLGANIRYILSLEASLKHFRYLFLDLAGLDYVGIEYIFKLLPQETKRGKSFILYSTFNDPFLPIDRYPVLAIRLLKKV